MHHTFVVAGALPTLLPLFFELFQAHELQAFPLSA